MIILEDEDYNNNDLLKFVLSFFINISILAFISVIASIALVATCIVISAIGNCLDKIWNYLFDKNKKQNKNLTELVYYHTTQPGKYTR